MERTTTREERAARGHLRNVLVATILAISTVPIVCVAAARAQVVNPAVAKPPVKKPQHAPAKAVAAKPAEQSTADQLNAKWLAEHSQTLETQPTAAAAAASSAPTPPIAGEEDRFLSLSMKSTPVPTGARVLVQGSVAVVKSTGTAIISSAPGGVSLVGYKEVAQAFSGFSLANATVEIDKGRTADGTERLLFASIGEGKSKQSFWWFAPPDQPEGWFDDSGHRLGGTMLAVPKPDSRISSPFGTRRYYGRTTGAAFHNGIDFEGKVGEPIYAAADGVINHMGWYYNYGRTVKVTHADNFETLYAHMSRFPPGMGAGTVVHTGELIGYVGSTGHSTGPHLHFSTILNGQFVDPEPYLSQEGDGQLNGESLVAFRQWQQDLRLAADPRRAGKPTVVSASQQPPTPPAAADSWSQSPFAAKGNSLLGHL